VVDVSRPDILKIHSGMAATPYQANRALAVVCSLFNFAILAGDRLQRTNPTAGIEPYPERGASASYLPATGLACEALADTAAEVSAYEGKVRDVCRRFAAARAVNRKAGGTARARLLSYARRARGRCPRRPFCFRLRSSAPVAEIQTLQWPGGLRTRGGAPPDSDGRKDRSHPPPA
jgi:hypothetical protein